jgi:hypothetical protein
MVGSEARFTPPCSNPLQDRNILSELTDCQEEHSGAEAEAARCGETRAVTWINTAATASGVNPLLRVQVAAAIPTSPSPSPSRCTAGCISDSNGAHFQGSEQLGASGG